MAIYAPNRAYLPVGDPFSWKDENLGINTGATPGFNDTIDLYGNPGADLIGIGTIDQLTVRASASYANAPTVAGQITAHQATITNTLYISAGALLTLTGRASPGALPTSALINAPVSIGAQNAYDAAGPAGIAAAGTLTIGLNSQSATPYLLATSGSTITALAAIVGQGSNAGLTLVGAGTTFTLTANPALEQPTLTSGTLTLGLASTSGVPTAGAGHLSIAAGATLAADGAITLAQDLATTADLTIDTGGTLTTGNTLTLGALGTATGRLTGSNTLLNAAGRLTVGAAGTGTLTIANGATAVTGADIILGLNATSHGTVTISANGTLRTQAPTGATGLTLSGTSVLTVTGANATLDIGASNAAIAPTGNATLSLSAGASARMGALSAATQTGSTAAISLEGITTALAISGPTALGNGGRAALALNNGATLTSTDALNLGTGTGTASLALGSGATATFLGPVAAGPAATINISSGATLGAGFLTLAGALSLQSAGQLHTTGLLVAGNATGALRVGAASLNLAGINTLLDSQGAAVVGRANPAMLAIDSGATLSANTITIGDALAADFGGASTARITNGASLRSRGNLTLGNDGSAGALLLDTASTATATQLFVGVGPRRTGGSGALTIQAGSTLRATQGAVFAGDIGTTATATVTGPNTVLDAGGALIVGQRGNATINVGSGATLLSSAQTGPALVLAATTGSIGSLTLNGSHVTVSGTTVLGPGTAILAVNAASTFSAASLTLGITDRLSIDNSSQLNLGASATSQAGLNIAVGAVLTDNGGAIYAPINNAGTFYANAVTLAGSITGPGTTIITGGTLDLTSLTGAVTFDAAGETLRLHTMAGPLTATLMTDDVIDLTNLSASLAGHVLTVAGVAIALNIPQGDIAILTNLNGDTRLTTSDPLFDTAYYLAHNPDVAAAAIDPYLHYLNFGWKEGRNPSSYFNTNYYLSNNPAVVIAGSNPLVDFEASGWKLGRNPDAFFNTSYYLQNNQDVSTANIDPLLHYINSGWHEGRNPSAQFSLSDYRAANPDVAAAKIDPLLHYLNFGQPEGRVAYAVGPTFEPGFDSAYYYATNPDVKAAGVDAYAHWLGSGWREGRNPNAWFDTNFYLTQNPAVRAAGVDPLAQFITIGAAQGHDPSLLFSDAKYLAANPDVAAAGLNPLLHYLSSGSNEGRIAFLAGPAIPADPLVQAFYYDPQLGADRLPSGPAAEQQAAANYASTGWLQGLNPDPFFNTNYYLSHNPDVAAAHIDPLLHYEVNGWKEGRDPSAQFSTNKYLAAYTDVRNANMDPLIHFIQSGQAEHRQTFTV